MITQLVARLNSCFKMIGLLLPLFFLGEAAMALNITAIYSSTCQRPVGTILNVDDNKVRILQLDGTIESISRFEIIYIAYYTLGNLPVKQVNNPSEVPAITIKTVFDDTIVDLASGWPVDFSEEQISLLTLNGDEVIVDRKNIWELEYPPMPEYVEFTQSKTIQYHFLHPYPFAHCNGSDSDKKKNIVYPQQLLGDPLFIKNELDRLQEGYEKIKDYYRDKQFYAVPEIYSNDTFLGVWLNYGSRHGASKNRSNNFIPQVTSELSEGPFGFQRVLITGSAPMPYSVHEEPQTQFYYRLKADYVHFSFMYDINRILLGEEQYKWTRDELEKQDDRMNELQHLNLGFDYGPFAIEGGITSLQYAVRMDDQFFRHRVNLNKFAVSYQNLKLKSSFQYGFAVDGKVTDYLEVEEDDEPEIVALKERLRKELENKADFLGEIKFYRLNLEWDWNTGVKTRYSLIHRTTDLEQGQDAAGLGEFHYQGATTTNSLLVSWFAESNLLISGYVSLEQLSKKYGVKSADQRKTSNYLKTGCSLNLLF